MQTQTTMQPAAVGTTTTVPVMEVFDAPEAAERGYNALLEMGYTHDEINVLMSAEARKLFRSGNPVVAGAEGTEVSEATNKVLGGAGAISAAGAVSGIVAGIGASLLVPGLGLVVAGPLAALGAGLGAALGAMYGIPMAEMAGNETATQENNKLRRGVDYHAQLNEGKVLISVEPHSPEDRERIEHAWKEISSSFAKEPTR
ncbi:MAG TPA: hypothetical protein PLD20_01455 [Blastocatellia bacterium]|nr:hypothetical protein [Blastocatellia bacterium]HMV83322.1 hypothetical protein [Blastocatellia bacterium]HMX24222.1 hypothetical protein [Blastocatellia bacterium]HMY75570.1 hypothetical protein [Blastocatellia bacterium]HMZ16603.1 hypothetical protein [Blastocatellia bacterium]